MTDPINLVITDPNLIAAIKRAAETGRMVEHRARGHLVRAKALRSLDTLAVRVLQWIEAHGHGTVSDVSHAINADVSSVTRAAYQLLEAGQLAIVYEAHPGAGGQRKRRLRLAQPKRVTVDLSAPTPRKPSH